MGNRSWEIVADSSGSSLRVTVGAQKLLLLAETDAPANEPLTCFYSPEGATSQIDEPELPQELPETLHQAEATGGDVPEFQSSAAYPTRREGNLGQRTEGSKGAGKGGGKGGKGAQDAAKAKDELPTPATMPMPSGVSEAGIIVVLSGHLLRETASLTSVICAVHGACRDRAPVPTFHLVSDIRQILLDKEEELDAVAAAFSADGSANTAVELEGQACVPPGAALLTEGSGSALPEVNQLPAIVNFKLRMPSLGLITKLRDRYCCTISEVFHGVLQSLLSNTQGA